MAEIHLKKIEIESQPILVEMSNKALEAKCDSLSNVITDTYATKEENSLKLNKNSSPALEVYGHEGAEQLMLSIDNTGGEGTPLSLITSGAVQAALSSKVSDVTVNGISTVLNGVAAISLGDGLKYNAANKSISISLEDLSEIVPKQYTLAQQTNMMTLVNYNGTLSGASLNNLDYSKLKVVNREDLSIINVDDFLFLKED